MDRRTRKKYIRMIYAKSLYRFGAALVLCALISGIFHSRLYFVFSACAAGFVFICGAWFIYMRRTGLRVFGFAPDKKPRVPYVHQRFKRSVPHRPSFAMRNEDFDDDLVELTAADDESFTEAQRDRARSLYCFFCGLLLIAVSLFVYYV